MDLVTLSRLFLAINPVVTGSFPISAESSHNFRINSSTNAQVWNSVESGGSYLVLDSFLGCIINTQSSSHFSVDVHVDGSNFPTVGYCVGIGAMVAVSATSSYFQFQNYYDFKIYVNNLAIYSFAGDPDSHDYTYLTGDSGFQYFSFLIVSYNDQGQSQSITFEKLKNFNQNVNNEGKDNQFKFYRDYDSSKPGSSVMVSIYPYFLYSDTLLNIEETTDGVSASSYLSSFNSAMFNGFYSGFEAGYFDGGSAQQGAINASYNKGYSQGKTAGYNAGYQAGIAKGDKAQYDKGYNAGYNKGATESGPGSVILSLFAAIADVPIAILNGFAGFTIWDTSLIAILSTLLFLALVLWVLKKVL